MVSPWGAAGVCVVEGQGGGLAEECGERAGSSTSGSPRFLLKTLKETKLPRIRINFLLKIILPGLHEEFSFFLITWLGPTPFFVKQ